MLMEACSPVIFRIVQDDGDWKLYRDFRLAWKRSTGEGEVGV